MKWSNINEPKFAVLCGSFQGEKRVYVPHENISSASKLSNVYFLATEFYVPDRIYAEEETHFKSQRLCMTQKKKKCLPNTTGLLHI